MPIVQNNVYHIYNNYNNNQKKIPHNVHKSITYIVIHKMMPFLVLSGKSIDDLGFPGSC